MSEPLTPERLAELRRIAEAAVQGDWYICHPNCRQVWVRDDGPLGGWCVAICDTQESGEGFTPEAMDANARHIATFDPPTVMALLDEIERLRREREAALDILGREDIGDGAKVEGVRLILKGGNREWPTRESERARLVGEVGECCRGADPLCAAGCLVEAALRQRLVAKVRGDK